MICMICMICTIYSQGSWSRSTREDRYIPGLYDLCDLHDLYDLYDLYDLAHVAGWEPDNLHVRVLSWYTVVAGGSTGLRWGWLNNLACVWKLNKRFHVERLPLVGHHEDKMQKKERKKRSDERVSDVRVHGRPRSSHIYGYTYVDVCILPGRCMERPTAMFLDASSWKLHLFRANAMIRRTTTSIIVVPGSSLVVCTYP